MTGLLGPVTAIVAAAAAALSSAVPASSAPAGGCYPAHARQLARSRSARVYEIGPVRPGPLAGARVYACYLRRGRPVALGATAERMRVGPVRLAGAEVAYGATSMGVDTGFAQVVVLNLATGARRSAAAATPPTRPESFSSVTALVVTSAGSAAWIASRSGIGQTGTYEVHRSDRAGAVLLDSGPAIAPSSLERRGSTVTWTNSGRVRSAPLR